MKPPRHGNGANGGAWRRRVLAVVMVGTFLGAGAVLFRLDPAREEPAGDQPYAVVGGDNRVHCPTCKAAIEVPRELYDASTQCPRCGAQFIIRAPGTPPYRPVLNRATFLFVPLDQPLWPDLSPTQQHAVLALRDYLNARLESIILPLPNQRYGFSIIRNREFALAVKTQAPLEVGFPPKPDYHPPVAAFGEPIADLPKALQAAEAARPPPALPADQPAAVPPTPAPGFRWTDNSGEVCADLPALAADEILAAAASDRTFSGPSRFQVTPGDPTTRVRLTASSGNAALDRLLAQRLTSFVIRLEARQADTAARQAWLSGPGRVVVGQWDRVPGLTRRPPLTPREVGADTNWPEDQWDDRDWL